MHQHPIMHPHECLRTFMIAVMHHAVMHHVVMHHAVMHPAVMHHAAMHTAVTMITIDQPTSTTTITFLQRQRIHCTTLCTASYAQSICSLQTHSSTLIPPCHANAYRPSYSSPCESHIQHSTIDYITMLQTIYTFRDDHTYYIRYNDEPRTLQLPSRRRSHLNHEPKNYELST